MIGIRRAGPEGAPQTRARLRAPLVALACLGALGVLLYGPYLGGPLVFDSAIWFSPENLQRLAHPENLDRLLSKSWTLASHRLLGGSISALQTISVLLHALTAWLLYRLIQALAACLQPPDGPSAGSSVAMIASVLFLAHPAAAYCVGDLGQQELILATLFCILFLLAHLHGLRHGTAASWVLAALAYLAAMLSKETVVMAPAIAFALTLAWRRTSTQPPAMRWWPFALYALIALGFVVLERAHLGSEQGGLSTTLLPAEVVAARTGDPATLHLRSIATQCAMYFRYLVTMLAPDPRAMWMDMQLPLLATLSGWRAGLAVAAFLAYGAAVFALLWFGVRLRLLALGLLWPWLGFATEWVSIRSTEGYVVYRTYFWLPGMALASACCLQWLRPRPRQIALVVIAGLFFFAARDRLGTLTDPLRLWDEAVRRNQPYESASPAPYRAYVNRGRAHSAAGDHLAALADYERALQLAPGVALIHMNRGVSRAKLGRYEEALADFDAALAGAARYDDTDKAHIHFNRANALIAMGRSREAMPDLEAAARLAPLRSQFSLARDKIRRRVE